MTSRLNERSQQFFRGLLANLSTIAVTLPVMAVSLLLTFVLAFWLNSLMEQTMVRYISRRIMLILLFPGCLASLGLNGFVIYQVSRYFEKRFGKSKAQAEKNQ